MLPSSSATKREAINTLATRERETKEFSMFYMNNFVIVNRGKFSGRMKTGATLKDRKTKFTSLIYSGVADAQWKVFGGVWMDFAFVLNVEVCFGD
jgi:hypothetical protein